MRDKITGWIAAVLLLTAGGSVHAQKAYGPGVSDTEIKIGQTNPYSGPVSAASVNGKMMNAYFNMVNAKGGINGRKIKFISLDDEFSPPRTLEHHRKLVEDEGVFAIIGTLGTPTLAAVQKYLNQKKVPSLLLISGAKRFIDPKESPYTMGYYPSYEIEAVSYARYLAKNKPDAKVAILYQNDDLGKDFLRAFKAELGSNASRMVVREASYETSAPSIDSQIIALKGSGADTLLDVTTQKFGAQAIRKVHDLGWKPLHFISFIASSKGAVLTPAGLDISTGLVTGSVVKDPANIGKGTDRDVAEYLSFMAKWYPEGDPSDTNTVWAYTAAQLATLILERCKDNLTRENLLKQATSLKNVKLAMLLDGTEVNITPDDYLAIKKLRLQRFDGKAWVPMEDVSK
ncbi:amino acid/amide ABC transporter substrate-binding protein, HAAT family [Variovorax sp. YR266]|uniref:ABC transporter substrate-binding protein n=1 Tax=Variovorax sp. YR266 TaxID=1884386 RepID=UPI0008970C44|nr:ABC transporter substrate-binding protein [Variovorax sp. YR266]SDY34276.1 amino acid/amide ABC transporter substrate-binding protein, HAAT family [Variovorax sp. YR266]